jgi:hypothetical protein
MTNGLPFLQNQVATAVAQHEALLKSLVDHEAQADDPRLRDLCGRYLPHMRDHQRMLEQYQHQISSPATESSGIAGSVTGAVKRIADTAANVATQLADIAPVSDYTRLLADLGLSRQCETSFKVFRDAGRTLGITSLAKIGEIAERHHDDFAADGSRLLQQMFIERTGSAAETLKNTTKEAGLR